MLSRVHQGVGAAEGRRGGRSATGPDGGSHGVGPPTLIPASMWGLCARPEGLAFEVRRSQGDDRSRGRDARQARRGQEPEAPHVMMEQSLGCVRWRRCPGYAIHR